MKNWKKDRNYRKFSQPDGTYRYVITIDNEDVDVTEEVYMVYSRSERQLEYIEYDLKRDRVRKDSAGRAVRDEDGLPIMLPEREVSLEKLLDEGWDFRSPAPSPEEIVFDDKELEIEKLSCCVSMLSDDEQALITALFHKGIRETEYAEMLGVKRQSINERKHRVLKKIKSFWGQPC